MKHKLSPSLLRSLVASLALALLASLTVGLPSAAAGNGNGNGTGNGNGSACINARLNVKVLLQGSYDSGGLMRTTLNDRNLIPLVNPRNSNFVTTQTVLDGNGQGAKRIVDWIRLEVVEAGTDLLVGETTGLLQANGRIVNEDGNTLRMQIPDNPNLDFRINVYHQNHMPVQSADVSRTGNKLKYDFKKSNLVPPTGQHQIQVGNNKYAMFAGNGDQFGGYMERSIDFWDVDVWSNLNGNFNAYLSADYNLDGDVNGADKILSVNNDGNVALFNPPSGSLSC